jgi:osmotically-inducible protein OsmY
MKTSSLPRDAHARAQSAAQSSPSSHPLRGIGRALAAAALVVGATSQLTACVAPVIAVGAVAGTVVSATDRRPTPTQTVDRGLQLEVESTLASRYNGIARVNVTVFNRKVLLTGEAKDANVKQQIDQYVRGLPNAREVINEIEIVSTPGFAAQSQDAYITSKVKTMLITAEGVPSNSIKVSTEKSVVYLMGVVTPAEGDRATEAARNVSGVAKVVKAFDYVSDAERARLDAAASSQNTPPGGDTAGGTPAPVQSTPAAPAQPAHAPAPGAAVTSPVPAPVTPPVAVPPGRALP